MSHPVPFATAAEAWFWTMAHLAATSPFAGGRPDDPPRPCSVEDVLRCLDQLYRKRRIQIVHARILRIWGERGRAPDPRVARERCDAELWREALERLGAKLQALGYVAPAPHQACRRTTPARP